MMEAFAAGVNYYLSRDEGSLPFEFALLGFKPEPWKAADELAGLYYMAWALNFSFHSEILYSAIIDKVGPELAADLFVPYPDNAPTIIGGEGFVRTAARLLETMEQARLLTGVPFPGASNNWVVSGAKSETGAPLLANDMHLGLMIPNIWYEAHVTTPEMNVSGVLLPGIPVVVAGANEHIAWGFTNVMADDADYYQEKLHPDDSARYEFMGRWENMTFRHDTIMVRDSGPVPITIRMTRHGPIIDDIVASDSFPAPRPPISMRWTIWDFSGEAQALYLVNRARNIDDVERAASLHKCPGQNWVYADDGGDIGFTAAVGIPIREGFVGDKILPGWDGEHEWSGYVPTKQQPHMRNPSSGWIATANNKHIGGDYPYVISNLYAPPDRFVRISRMLCNSEKLSIDDFRRMQADEYMVMAETWAPLILSAVDPASADDLHRQALDTLRNWDFEADSAGIAPAIFHVLFQKTMEHMFAERLGDTLYQRWLVNAFIVHDAMYNLIGNAESAWFDDPATDGMETRDDVLRRSFDEAVVFLDSIFGDDMSAWTWGKLHHLTFLHPVGAHIPVLGGMMNVGPFHMGGASNTVNAGLYRLTQPWRMLAGSSQRHIFDLGETERSLRIIPTGISGNFMSDHYDDQVELWRHVDYRPFHLDRDKIEAEAAYRMKMAPAAGVESGERTL